MCPAVHGWNGHAHVLLLVPEISLSDTYCYFCMLLVAANDMLLLSSLMCLCTLPETMLLTVKYWQASPIAMFPDSLLFRGSLFDLTLLRQFEV